MAPKHVLSLGLFVFALALHCPAAALPEPPEPPYALDMMARTVPATGPLKCPEIDLSDYKGDIVPLSSTTKVFTGFRDRLKEFEKIARDSGIETYGRPPSQIVHLGTYQCRRIAAYPDWLSEHALGNAIDIAGFDFGPLPKGASLPSGLPGAFKNGFEVRVLSHWKAKSGDAAAHAGFLKTVAQRLIARKDIFRVLLGPGYPGHANHFHFDIAPFRMVEIYDDGQPLVAPAVAQSPDPSAG
jgi:hypothetical protein